VVAAAGVEAAERATARRRAAGRAGEIVGRVLLALAAVAFALLAGEIAARVVGLETPAYFGTGGESCMQRSARLGVELRPGCTGTVAGTAFRTNALGLRGPEVGHAPFSILALGDSCTWGFQVADDDTYPAVLQRLLDRRTGPGRYQVINAGVPGWTSHQGLLYLEERGVALKPDVVVAGFAFNDGFAMGDIEQELARARRLLPLLRLDDALLDDSVLYRWSRFKLAGPLRVGGTPRVTPERYRANLERLVAVAAEHHARAAFVDWNLAYLPRYRAAAQAVADEHRLPRVVYDGERVDLVHPDRAGYVALATALLDALERAGYLPF
jgi:lysophospholipase L1-like esterase